jgi:hypothetical protein
VTLLVFVQLVFADLQQKANALHGWLLIVASRG